MEIDPNSNFEPPNLDNLVIEEAAVPYEASILPASELSSKVEQVKQAHEARLMAMDGVMGVGVGRNPIGDDAIVVYLRDYTAQKNIPTQLDGVPVMFEITGIIDAY
jgi:hypothetical protein